MSGIDLEDDLPAGATDETPKGSAAASVVDDDVEFGDEKEYRRPGELDLLKVTQKNSFIRFSILINPATGKAFMKRAFIHYAKDKGYARCHSKRDAKGNIVGQPAFCCKVKEAESRYAALVVEYQTIDPKNGKFLKDRAVEFELKALPLSRIGYKDISMLPGEDHKVTDLDITGTPKDQSKGTAYARMTDKASYTRNPELNAAVTEAMKPYLDGRELHRKCGKDLNVAEMKAHMGLATGADDSGPGMDDLD